MPRSRRVERDEQILRHIIDFSPVPMVLYNEAKGDYFYNKKFTETFGYTIEDVPDINAWWKRAYPDEKYRESVKKDGIEWSVTAHKIMPA